MNLNQWLEEKLSEAWRMALRGKSPDERDEGVDLIDKLEVRLLPKRGASHAR